MLKRSWNGSLKHLVRGCAYLSLASALLIVALLASGCVTSANRRTEEPDSRPISQKLGSLRMEGPRKRILLLPILNDSVEKDPAISKNGREALVTGLRLTDNFIILDNNDAPKDLKLYKKDNGYDIDEVSKIAAEMGAVAVVEGKVIEIKVRRSGDDVGLIRSVKAEVSTTVGIKVYSAANHKEVMNEVRSAASDAKSTRIAESDRPSSLAADPQLTREALTSAFQGMILSITKSVDKLNWNGRIALVNGDRLYINAGRITGINVGDILRVTEEGDEVFDPNTGVLIGKAPGRMKGTLEIVSYFGKDGSVAVVHSGSGFKENDHVELY